MCTLDIQFEFNNTVYCQSDSVTMERLLGLNKTDISMGYLVNIVIKQATSKTKEYCRYVDHTFTVFNDKQYAIRLFNLFIIAHLNIQFTMNHEQNDMFHFIAIRHRRNGTFERSVYRKRA